MHDRMMVRDAVLSQCERYRYTLSRRWDTENSRRVLWVMLNPSTADGREDDPTVRRCVSLSRRFGAGSMVIVNLFAYRTSSPSELWAVAKSGFDIIGPHGMEATRQEMAVANDIVVAWGNGGANPVALGRVQLLTNELSQSGRSVHQLGSLTAQKQPRHPLYVASDIPILPWLKLKQPETSRP